MEINEESPKIDQILDINIVLKDHQLAIINKCIEIENVNICNFGIMNDRPGTGKTYAILGLIYYTKKKMNIIVVPQNIFSQWCESINTFSNSKLKYKKFINYSDILELYDDNNNLFEYDILLTTSLYYNVIATTIKSRFLNVERVFFDEIDSISSLLINEINSNFIWFVSATFNINSLGYYKNKLVEKDIENITCKCDDDFIDSNILLDPPIKKYYLCKNIYIDNILDHVLSNDELKSINALDYTLNNKDFENKKVKNEKNNDCSCMFSNKCFSS